MGKHGNDYRRVAKDLYPTPSWVVEALAEHLDLAGKDVWECAAGNGDMAAAIKAAGAARVFASDVVERGYPLDAVFDFLSEQNSKWQFDLIVTNPPYGLGNGLAVKFIETGLRRIANRGALALLLPVDFDSGKTRHAFFRDCRLFAGKVVLTKRVAWFERDDGQRAAPKENSAWFIWCSQALSRPPIILYAPN